MCAVFAVSFFVCAFIAGLVLVAAALAVGAVFLIALAAACAVVAPLAPVVTRAPFTAVVADAALGSVGALLAA